MNQIFKSPKESFIMSGLEFLKLLPVHCDRCFIDTSFALSLPNLASHFQSTHTAAIAGLACAWVIFT